MWNIVAAIKEIVNCNECIVYEIEWSRKQIDDENDDVVNGKDNDDNEEHDDELFLQVFNTYFWKVDGYRRILEKVSQVLAIELARDSDVGSNDESSYIYTTHSRRHSSSSALLDSATCTLYTVYKITVLFITWTDV